MRLTKFTCEMMAGSVLPLVLAWIGGFHLAAFLIAIGQIILLALLQDFTRSCLTETKAILDDVRAGRRS